MVYLLILVPLAFACSLMLFKVMRSYATYKGTYQNHQLELAGPVVVFMLIIGTGYYFSQHPPPSDDNAVTIHFYDVDEPTKPLEGAVTITYKGDVRDYTVRDGSIRYERADPGTQIFVAYNFSETKHIDTLIVPQDHATLQVPIKKNATLDAQKKILIGKLLTRLNVYCVCAKNFASFMKDDMENVFNGEKGYLDDLNRTIDAYSAARDSLFAIKDSLINSLRPFLGANTAQVTQLFSDFVAGHTQNFYTFNEAIRKKLIEFSKGELNKSEQKGIIEDAASRGELAQVWLNGFQEKVAGVKQLISTL